MCCAGVGVVDSSEVSASCPIKLLNPADTGRPYQRPVPQRRHTDAG
jgi:hypothetical protein